MLKGIQLNVTQDNLGKLLCSACKGYLCCAPIRSTSDGDNICGQCTPEKGALTCRQVTLEALLSDAIFPCRFQQNGCTTELLFDHTVEHEDECVHRPIPCITDCEWMGQLEEAPDHFLTAHADLVKLGDEFELDLEEDQEGFIMIKNNGTFLVKYEYSADRRPFSAKLKYDVRCFTESVVDNYCKICLISGADSDYNINLKGSSLAVFSDNLFDDPSIVSMEAVQELLDEPTTVTIAFSVALPCATSSEILSVVNYDAIDSLRCKKCQFYLVPPLFEVEDGVVCCDCRDPNNSKPSTNEELLVKVSTENFPCRWHGCEFATTADLIREHEAQCASRIYRCILSGSCSSFINRSDIKTHAEKHHKNIDYFSDVLSYNFRLNCGGYAWYSFTIVNNEVVLVKWGVPSRESKHFISLQTTKLSSKKFKASVYFEHSHCKYKSKRITFISDQELHVFKSDLPSCFGVEDKLTGNLKIECIA